MCCDPVAVNVSTTSVVVREGEGQAQSADRREERKGIREMKRESDRSIGLIACGKAIVAIVATPS